MIRDALKIQDAPESGLAASRFEKFVADVSAQMRAALGDAGHPLVYEALATAAWLHAEKNKGYRSTADPFANFRESSPVIKRLLTPAQYAYVLCAKQDDALPRLLWAKEAEYEERGGDATRDERLLDGIAYRAIIWALVRA